MSANDIAAVTAHQLGLAIDATLLTPADRDAWRAVRGFSAQWGPGGGTTDLTTGAGDFAEAFTAWQLGTRTRSLLADQPDPTQLQLLARLIRLAPSGA